MIPKADGTAVRVTQEAEGYKQKVIAGAKGEVDRFSAVLAEYEKAPKVTRDRMYIETMQQVMANSSKIMIDVKQGSPLMYLPLDKIMQLSGGDAPVQAVPMPSAPATPAGSGIPDPRSRDASRSRERDGR